MQARNETAAEVEQLRGEVRGLREKARFLLGMAIGA